MSSHGSPIVATLTSQRSTMSSAIRTNASTSSMASPSVALGSMPTRTAIASRPPVAVRTASITSSQKRARLRSEPPYSSSRRLAKGDRNCAGRYECEPYA